MSNIFRYPVLIGAMTIFALMGATLFLALTIWVGTTFLSFLHPFLHYEMKMSSDDVILWFSSVTAMIAIVFGMSKILHFLDSMRVAKHGDSAVEG